MKCFAMILTGGLALASATVGAADPYDAKLVAAVNSDFRPATDKARDAYRHPLQTLTFFGLKPTMTVVELWPFGGWYTQILAPYLHDHGKLYAAAMDPASTAQEDRRYNADLESMLSAHPAVYDRVKITVLSKTKMQIAPDGTADLVLTFRNIHNWVWDGMEKEVLAAAFRALKPGGVLGVEEHQSNDPHARPQSGQAYVGEQYAIDLVESAGFKFLGRSDVNRNPKDTKDYPKGVWTLPPTFAEGDKDRAKYAAIGESDRFTLKFIKPKS